MNPLRFVTEPAIPAAAPRRIWFFHWYGWRRFLRDLLIMQAGFALTGLAVGILVNSGVGHVATWGFLEYAWADFLSIEVGFAYMLVTAAAVSVAVLLREQFSWGTAVSFFFVTFVWVDMAEQLVPSFAVGTALEIVCALAAVLLMAFGTAIFLSVNAGPPPRDSLWLAIARVLGVNAAVARVILELSLVLIGAVLLGSSTSAVTFVYALAAGPAVWLAFRVVGIGPKAESWGR